MESSATNVTKGGICCFTHPLFATLLAMRFSVALLLACVPASLAAQTLLVANQRVATVTLIDTATNHVTAT